MLIISYVLTPPTIPTPLTSPTQPTTPQISFRENHGKWLDLSGSDEPQWQTLDGNDVVLTFDAASLDKVKTHGLVITGKGFTLTRVQLMKVQ